MNRIRAWLRLKMGWIPRPVRRAIVSVVGGTLLLLALIGFVMPIMPGFIFVPFGLGILAIEFAWAARWLRKIRKKARSFRARVRSAPNAAVHADGTAVGNGGCSNTGAHIKPAA